MKILLQLILFFLAFEASAESVIFCSHREICHVINLIAKESHLSNIKTSTLVNISGDPHEYEPSTNEIKNLMNAPLLVTGPSELNPWIKKVNFQRSKMPNLKTISLSFDKKDLAAYPNATTENLSHFWLYPRIYCSFKIMLSQELSKLGFIIDPKNVCNPKAFEDELKLALIKTNYPIILTHDALLPLMQGLDKNHTIAAIKGSGHHEEANAQSIKKMYDALKAPVVLWVIEAGINIPQNIHSKMRKNDIVLSLDSANSKSDLPFSVLRDLIAKLNSISQSEKSK
jgi:hypothetical protein